MIGAALVLSLTSLPSNGETRPKKPVANASAVVPLKQAPTRGVFVLGLMAGPAGSTEFAIAADMAAMAAASQEGGPHGETGPRLAPLIGRGPAENLSDLLASPSTDLAITTIADLQNAAKDRPSVRTRVAYVARLFPEEVHVVARAETTALRDLAGKRVYVGAARGAGSLMFEQLGIDVERVTNLAPEAALVALQEGSIDAAVIVSGKPVPALAELPADSGLRLLPVAYERALTDAFLPARLDASDYGSLLPGGEIDTIGVSTVLVAYRWPRRSERAQLLETMVTSILDKAGGPMAMTPKWREVNWASTLPGWTREPAVERWLARHQPEPQPSTGARR